MIKISKVQDAIKSSVLIRSVDEWTGLAISGAGLVIPYP